MELAWYAASADDMAALGAALAGYAPPGIHIHLHGDLAAGKTTLARGYLRALGHGGAVKSPTFTLVESYVLPGRRVHHFDLYRLRQAGEFDFLGVEDYETGAADALVEWAERAQGRLRTPDLAIAIAIAGKAREVCVRSASRIGTEVISSVAESLKYK